MIKFWDKNTFNSQKSNLAPLETSDPTMAKPEYSNAAETQRNEVKNYFVEMIEALKSEIKKSLKRSWRKDRQTNFKDKNKTKKKPKQINSLQKAKKKAIKQVKETIQDLKT